GAASGYAHGLKYAFGPEAYALLAANVADPFTASDSTVAPYADLYAEYDSQQRTTKTVVAGAGTTYGTRDGRRTTPLAYTTSSNAAGYNSWKTKAVETLPDGNQNIVYTNTYGQVMLSAFKEVATGNQWINFNQYDTSGRLILTASPSAVTGYNDTYADLL